VSEPVWNHDALARDLAQHLSGASDRMLWLDVQLGPRASPRPDVYSIAKSYVHPNPRAYEVKISRADFLRDTGAGKWTNYLKFAGAIYFAAPAGMLKPADLPAGCGLIVRGEEHWRAVRAPRVAPCKIPTDALLKLLIEGEARRFGSGAKRRNCNEWLAEQALAKKFGEKAAHVIANLASAEERLREHKERQRAHDEDHEKKLRERARREIGEIDEERKKACRALGLREDGDWWELRHALARSLAALAGNAEVERLRGKLELLRRTLDDVPLPLEHLRRELVG